MEDTSRVETLCKACGLRERCRIDKEIEESCKECEERRNRLHEVQKDYNESTQREANARERVRQLKKELKAANAALVEEQKAHDETKQKLRVAQENQYAVYEGAAKEWDKTKESFDKRTREAEAFSMEAKSLLWELFYMIDSVRFYLVSKEEIKQKELSRFDTVCRKVDAFLHPPKNLPDEATWEKISRKTSDERSQEGVTLRDTKELLREAFETMRHARVFIGSKVTMRSDGRELYDGLLEKIDLYLYPEKGASDEG